MANDDRFRNNSNPTQSGRNGYVAVPSNVDELEVMSRQLLILSDGDLGFVFAGYGDEEQPTIADEIIIPVKAGQTINYAVRFITTSTDAEVLVVY